MFRSERLKTNLKILNMLIEQAYTYPDLRFWQLLAAFKIVEFLPGIDKPEVKDGFYEESSETLSRLQNVIKSREIEF